MIRRALGILLVSSATLGAQVIPNARWQKIETQHFRVYFTPELESQARRAAGNAERAWTRLSQDLTPPRGPVELVIADNVDFTNGYATVYPTNRIVIYAHPPVHESSLRFYDDWSELVITHELTHIFHLDRTRGWWSVAQSIFGRDPLWFPNGYLPSWIVEGLAVYEESRHTGAGRLAGTTHRMQARASVIGGHLPRLDELSSSTSRFPGGGSVYTYGSLIIEFLAQTHGEQGVRKFVERTSAAPIPWLLNRQTEKSFGVSLERAWREWRDSLARTSTAGAPPLVGWKELTPRGRYAFHPRWASDSSLVYVGSTGKSVAAAYQVDLKGHSQRIGRRSAFDPNTPLSGGRVLYSELEFVTPYEMRSDLWIQDGSHKRRLTRGARLSYADARRDGKIVAVQAIPGSTRLVLLNANGDSIRPITSGSDDEQWAEPRWSPDGARVAAIRLLRGAIAELVVVDTTGALTVVTRERAVTTGVSWRSANELAFTSDRTGTTQIYVVNLASGDSTLRIRRASNVSTGVFSPEFRAGSDVLAAVHYRFDGYHVGVGTVTPDTMPVEFDTTGRRLPMAAATMDTSAASKYQPWSSLVPRYWRLAGEGSEDESIFGAFTSGQDIVGRHTYALQLQRRFDYPETGGFLVYRYAGLGRPLVDVSINVEHDAEGPITTNGVRDTVGELRSRTRTASLALTLVRPRVRSFAYASAGLGTELLNFASDPDSLMQRLNPILRETRALHTLFSTLGWSNTQRPELSISRENGVAVDGFGRVRKRKGDALHSHQAVAVARGYRAFDLGSWAHYVVAVRAAGGISDPQTTSDFSVGGISGETLEIIPGFGIGTESETFGVRGFPPSTIMGHRAVAGTVELRGPLFAPSRGYRILPVFLDRTSFALFGEGASAWCPETSTQYFCRSAPFDRRAIISVGGELGLLTAIQYDATLQLRFGFAAPVARAELARRRGTAYFTVGAAF